MKEIKNIVFWGGLNNHIFELTKAMKSLGYNIIVTWVSKEGEERLKQKPKTEGTDIEICYIDKIDDVVHLCQTYNNSNTLHINSALKNNGSIFNKALKYLCCNNCNVFSLPQESFQFQGAKGFVNQLKWYIYLNFSYRKYIKAYGLTGLNAEECFKKIGVNKAKLFPFIYVTKIIEGNNIFSRNNKVHFVFVGAIDQRKNIIPFVKLLQSCSNQNFEMNIYGTWSLDDELRHLVKDSKNIFFHGKQDYATVREKMISADYLVLPSLYDGWGAVANEGLQSGCKLILSKQSGCSTFTRIHKQLGYTIDAFNLSAFKEQLESIISEGPLDSEEKIRIKNWADENISPNIVAEYLNQLIHHYFGKGAKPSAPWMS